MLACLDVGRLVKAVHLVQQLQQDALHLAVGACCRVSSAMVLMLVKYIYVYI